MSEYKEDLIEQVRQLLVSAGLLQHVIVAYDTAYFITEAKGKDIEQQRYLLNRYWTDQLLKTSDDSREERYCLIPNGSIDDWLLLFKNTIIPFILKNDLPK